MEHREEITAGLCRQFSLSTMENDHKGPGSLPGICFSILSKGIHFTQSPPHPHPKAGLIKSSIRVSIIDNKFL